MAKKCKNTGLEQSENDDDQLEFDPELQRNPYHIMWFNWYPIVSSMLLDYYVMHIPYNLVNIFCIFQIIRKAKVALKYDHRGISTSLLSQPCTRTLYLIWFVYIHYLKKFMGKLFNELIAINLLQMKKGGKKWD